MKPHRFHPEADAEYAEAAIHAEAQLPGLGSQLFDEIEAVILAIREHPQRGRSVEAPFRRVLAPRFPYAVIYVERDDCVRIVAVMPLRRNPTYWRERSR